jgi:tRNA-dihydrouridine synthase A
MPEEGRRGASPRLSFAPMVDRTDRHFRVFMRGITRRTLLYTEMIVARALLDPRTRTRLRPELDTEGLGPVALQLAGFDRSTLAAAARIGEDAGFAEIDLNCGCPSAAAVAGGFGISLARRPDLVAEAVAAMRAVVGIPVTVKLRLGIEGEDDAETLAAWCDTVAAAGADRFVVHARSARLGGCSPRANRSVPPLRHDLAIALARARPGLAVELNGGLADLASAHAAIAGTPIESVMIGRAAWDDPWIFAHADSLVFGVPDPGLDRTAAVARMIPYAEAWAGGGNDPREPWRGVLGLLRGTPGARRVRTALATRGDIGPLQALVSARP